MARAERIERTIDELAGTIGPRSAHQQPRALRQARDFIEATWHAQGYQVERQGVIAYQGITTHNLIAKLPGAEPPLVVGAHYDTVPETPGADDNASGVAALLELTRAFAPGSGAARGRAVHFVAWTTEEPPFYATPSMGSAVHAASLDQVYGAISLETIGTFSDERGSQGRPFPLSLVVPSKGDFLAFVSTPGSHRFVRTVGRSFRRAEAFPTFGGTAPAWIQGMDWSDHRSYWTLGAPSVMVTDTAPFRTPHYHEPTDTPATIDPVSIARISRGLEAVVADLVATAEAPVAAPPGLRTVEPAWFEMTRGGRASLHGSGFDAATRVWADDRPLPVVRRRGDDLLLVRIEDLMPGTYDLRVANEAGETVLEQALTVGVAPPRLAIPCEQTVYFGHDSASVTGEAARTLERARFCFTAAGGPVEVVGYTDASGESGYNERLGAERAAAVAALLVLYGIDEERLQLGSGGEAAGPFPPEQRRRVEVRALPR